MSNQRDIHVAIQPKTGAASMYVTRKADESMPMRAPSFGWPSGKSDFAISGPTAANTCRSM